jgi:hypothetical protein
MPCNRLEALVMASPRDPIAHLARLWKVFEETGAVAAYVAHRMQLAHLARGHQMAGFWARRDLQ